MEQYLASSWIARSLVDCSNIVQVNLNAHKWNGIALVALTLIHVWSILLPCVVHRWSAQVVPGIFEYPLSERTPPGFQDANNQTKTMSLQVDDVFRMVEMTLLLGVLTPLSIRWMSNCWHLGIHVHRFVNILYFVDIVRRHSHPHSWVLNTPVFVIWMLDKVLSMKWRRQRPEVHREMISPNYIVLYWKNDAPESSLAARSPTSVGADYLMKLDNSSCLESRHTFTTFSHRSTVIRDLIAAKNIPDGFEWTTGSIIRVFDSERKPQIGETFSHTKRMKEERLYPGLSIWGGFQGKMSDLIPKALVRDDDSCSPHDVILVGSGSAINFMIDLLAMISMPGFLALQAEGRLVDVSILYTTRCPHLSNWVAEVVSSLLESIAKGYNDGETPSKQLRINILLACTDNKKTKYAVKEEAIEVDETLHVNGEDDYLYNNDIEHRGAAQTQTKSFAFTTPIGKIQSMNGRINYAWHIQNNSNVFCQGSESFKSVIQTACERKKDVRVFFD